MQTGRTPLISKVKRLFIDMMVPSGAFRCTGKSAGLWCFGSLTILSTMLFAISFLTLAWVIFHSPGLPEELFFNDSVAFLKIKKNPLPLLKAWGFLQKKDESSQIIEKIPPKAQEFIYGGLSRRMGFGMVKDPDSHKPTLVIGITTARPLQKITIQLAKFLIKKKMPFLTWVPSRDGGMMICVNTENGPLYLDFVPKGIILSSHPAPLAKLAAQHKEAGLTRKKNEESSIKTGAHDKTAKSTGKKEEISSRDSGTEAYIVATTGKKGENNDNDLPFGHVDFASPCLLSQDELFLYFKENSSSNGVFWAYADWHLFLPDLKGDFLPDNMALSILPLQKDENKLFQPIRIYSRTIPEKADSMRDLAIQNIGLTSGMGFEKGHISVPLTGIKIHYQVEDDCLMIGDNLGALKKREGAKIHLELFSSQLALFLRSAFAFTNMPTLKGLDKIRGFVGILRQEDELLQIDLNIAAQGLDL